MKLNPEFQRNIWLEATPHRFIATPVILFLFYLLLNQTGMSPKNFMLASIWIFLAFTCIYAPRQTSDSLATEVVNHTWTLQRLTSIGPWCMTWGKAFGSTIYSWYGALFPLAVFYYYAATPMHRPWSIVQEGPLKACLYLFGIALFFQWVPMLNMLNNLQKSRTIRPRHALATTVLMILAVIWVVGLATGQVDQHLIKWYSYSVRPFDFFLITLYTYLAWLIIGTYLLMRRELQIWNPIYPWLIFLAFINLYFMGFTPEQFATSLKINHDVRAIGNAPIGFLITSLLAYIMLFVEPLELIQFKFMRFYLKAKNFARFFEIFPRSYVTILASVGTAAWLYSKVYDFPVIGNFHTNIFLLSLFAFMLRDFALILHFQLTNKTKRAGTTSFIYLFVLYGLLPWLIHALKFDALQPFFTPSGKHNLLHAVAPAAIQAVILWVINLKLIKTFMKKSSL